MPYDVAGSDSTYLLSGADGKQKAKTFGGCGCCFLIGAIAFLAAGSAALGKSEEDTRGEAIDAFKEKYLAWKNTKMMATFESKRMTLNNKTMRGMTETVTPEDFGEKKPLFDTPPKIEDYRYVNYTTCPAGVNQTCNLTIGGAGGKVLFNTQIVPRRQWGPTEHRLTSELCQWYDNDYFHPMAALGFGPCKTKMHGEGHPQTYEYGPRCVLDHYLDEHGCPNDIIQSQQMVNYGSPRRGGNPRPAGREAATSRAGSRDQRSAPSAHV